LRKSSAALGSVLFFLFVPCVVAGLVPYLLTDRYGMPVLPHPAVAVVAGILIAAGLAVLIHAFVRFAVEGLGTPAPVAPTARLVVGGVYRHVRNPMYLAVVSIILGQALLFGAVPVAVYAAAVAAAVVSFVHFYEEPVLARRHGAEYEAYRRAVPGWLPRLTPWRQP
jgi:protein-S-isoprenylcysteine O-methyltransferase Ste14